jgi:hypothetical protein
MKIVSRSNNSAADSVWFDVVAHQEASDDISIDRDHAEPVFPR